MSQIEPKTFVCPDASFVREATSASRLHREYLQKIGSPGFEQQYLLSKKTFYVKRTIDISVALFGLSILTALLPIFGILIKLDSPGPIFIRQVRIGHNRRKSSRNRRNTNNKIAPERRRGEQRNHHYPGRPFYLIKFRTMDVGAEKETGAVWATVNDPRITRLGKWLRRYHLDELPQLWNVLIGVMSLVGPRPERVEFVEKLNQCLPGYGNRCLVPPGITGLAQMRNGYDTSVKDVVRKLRFDVIYIKKMSVGLDLVILIDTLGIVLMGNPIILNRHNRTQSLQLRRHDLLVSDRSIALSESVQTPCTPILNALTIDVEDYYQVTGFDTLIKYEDWDKYESRVEQNTRRLLKILAEYNVKATFFVLGWIAEQHPDLIRQIAREGHEIGSHGYAHKPIYDSTPQEFRDELRRSKHILESLTGQQVVGFRAANCSIINKTLWAQEILLQEGFEYDSSIFPIRHDRYGIPDAERFPYLVQNGTPNTLIEFPLSTIRFFTSNIPVAGGAYLRFFPISFINWGIKRINLVEQKPVIVYIHPWELDPDQPKQPVPFLDRVRHYHNLDHTEGKLRYLLRNFRFGPVSEVLSKTEYQKKTIVSHGLLQAVLNDQETTIN